MDVDGNEIDVLEGGAETFSRHAPLIMMEFSPDVFAEGGRSFKVLPDALVALGYRARTMSYSALSRAFAAKRLSS